jgi:hypothetical protein
MRIDFSNIETASAIPGAAAMIETFRAIGYSLETAIADIIDNSISAKAKNIYINRVWRGGNSIITIKDDGCGMNDEGIRRAMRPGAQNPLAERSLEDLGRFGLGLKTASFSQCRSLTVMSKMSGEAVSYWTWNLDYVAQTDKWELIKWAPEEYMNSLDNVESGTIVIWTSLDRIIPQSTKVDDDNAKRKFSEAFDKVKQHLAMTFHRFIENKTVKLYWAANEIRPWNPFCPEEDKLQVMPTEDIGNGVKVKGYILPHRNNFSSEQAYKNAEGIFGFSSHQGFYVYRGNRLLLAGDWLGLLRKEESYKLVRIQIDLPNSIDSDWQIDIKKSKAYPPIACRNNLIAYARNACGTGLNVYKHRGKIVRHRAGTQFQPLWEEKKKDDKWYFVVNRNHDMIRSVKTIAQDNIDRAIDLLLKFIEESIPTKTIYIREAKEEDSQKQPYSDVDLSFIKTAIELIYRNKIADGLTPEQARISIKNLEPFNEYEYLIEEML